MAPSLEIDSCRFLFLREIGEPSDNQLRIVIEEGIAGAEETTRYFGGVSITGRLVESTSSCRKFELCWTSYITYEVQNESYFAFDEYNQAATGNNLRVFSRSRLLDYLSTASFATSEYPGPFQHYCVSCENHIVHVVSQVAPLIARLGPDAIS